MEDILDSLKGSYAELLHAAWKLKRIDNVGSEEINTVSLTFEDISRTGADMKKIMLAKYESNASNNSMHSGYPSSIQSDESEFRGFAIQPNIDQSDTNEPATTQYEKSDITANTSLDAIDETLDLLNYILAHIAGDQRPEVPNYDHNSIPFCLVSEAINILEKDQFHRPISNHDTVASTQPGLFVYPVSPSNADNLVNETDVNSTLAETLVSTPKDVTAQHGQFTLENDRIDEANMELTMDMGRPKRRKTICCDPLTQIDDDQKSAKKPKGKTNKRQRKSSKKP